MTKYFLAILSVIFFFAACTTTPNPVTPDRAAMLRTGKWKIASGTFTKRLPGGTDTNLNYLSFIPLCHQDDYIVFDSQMHAATYSGATKCDPGEADHIPFVWQLKNNGNNIDLYNGFNNLYSAVETIQPYRFDTISGDFASGTLKLDTVIGVNDTPKLGHNIILDSIWDIHIDTMATPQIEIYNASITDFSQSAFTLHFTVISTYPDSNGNRANYPKIRPDTMKYTVKYTNF